LLFLTVILIPLLAGVVTGASEVETNSGTEFPSPELRLDYAGDLSEWLGERAATKNLAIRVDSWIDRNIFRERPSAGAESPRVTYGLSGVMFISDAFNEACNPHILTDDLIDRIHRLEQVIHDSGRDFHLLVSPDKSTILTSYLPEQFPLRSCFEEYNSDFWARLRGADIQGFIDLNAALTDARDTRRELLFKRRDTHWDDAGAVVASEALVNSVVPGLWDESAVTLNGLAEYFGDLNVLAGEALVDTAPSYSVTRPGVVQTSVILIDQLEHGRNRQVIHQAQASELIPGRTLILGDSFSESAEPFFAPYFEDLTLMRLVDFSVPRFIELIASADRIIFWSVERTFPYRVAFDWGATEFINDLETSLS
jgi:hypothetical protein